MSCLLCESRLEKKGRCDDVSVSPSLSHDAHIFGQTLFCMFWRGCFQMRQTFKSVNVE